MELSRTIENLRQGNIDRKLKAAVIGAGFGGLSLAIRLQAHGIQTTLYDKQSQVGGLAQVYNENGFVFDCGPTVITAPHCLEDLFRLTGRKISDYVELQSVMPFYRLYWENGLHFDYSNDMEHFEKQVREISVDDWSGYLKFLDHSRKVFEIGYEKYASVPFLNYSSMIKAGPSLFKLQAYRSVYSIISKYIKNDYLRQAMSFHTLLVGGSPFSSSSIYSLIHFLENKYGVYYARGGTGALVKGLQKYFLELKGEIKLNSNIKKIITKNNIAEGVILENNEFHKFDLVISNAHVAHTYLDLLSESDELKRRRAKLKSARYSMSLFLICFGTNRKYEDISHHNILFGKRYKGLIDDIFKKGKLADDFSIYLHRPTASDSSLAPEGCDTFYALSPVPNLFNSKIDWAQEAPIYSEKIINYLQSRYLPDLKKHIVVKKIFTPQDFAAQFNAYGGSVFSLEPILTQSAYFRVHNRDPDVRGLYIVGAGTHPGAGIPGVVNSAKATFDTIAADISDRIFDLNLN